MNLDQATIALVPRTTVNCLDLAVKFFNRHIVPVGEICLSVALPSGVLVYLLSVQLEMDVRLTLAVLYFATLPLGVLLIAGSTRAVFGESFVPSRVTPTKTSFIDKWLLQLADGISTLLLGTILVDFLFEALGSDLILTESTHLTLVGILIGTLALRVTIIAIRFTRFSPGFFKVLLAGIFRRLAIAIGPALVLFTSDSTLIVLGILTCIVTLVFLVRTGFQSEAMFLSALDRQLSNRKMKEVFKKEGSDLFLRGWWIVSFCSILTLVVFITVDKGSELLFDYPILMGRIADLVPGSNFSEGIFEYLMLFSKEVIQFAMSDSLTLAVITAVVMFVYPIGRLAWFFCYLDIRVRRDLWDLELQFHRTAQNLERASS